jgi:hypothetical protein
MSNTSQNNNQNDKEIIKFIDSLSSKLNYKMLNNINVDELKNKLDPNEKKILNTNSDDENIKKHIINISKKICSSLNDDNNIIKFINILLNCSIYYSLKYEKLFLNILNISKLLRALIIEKCEEQNETTTNQTKNNINIKLKLIKLILNIFNIDTKYDKNILSYLEGKYNKNSSTTTQNATQNSTQNATQNSTQNATQNSTQNATQSINNMYLIINNNTNKLNNYVSNITNTTSLHRIDYNIKNVKDLNDYLYYKSNERNPQTNERNPQPNERNPKYVLDYNIFEYIYNNKPSIPSITISNANANANANK